MKPELFFENFIEMFRNGNLINLNIKHIFPHDFASKQYFDMR